MGKCYNKKMFRANLTYMHQGLHKVYVCMYVRMYVCMYVHMYVCMNECMYPCMMYVCVLYQGCIQKFCRGGANLGYGQKRGGTPGGSSIVSCEVLHSRGGENDTRGGRMPPPAPPLKYGPVYVCMYVCMYVYVCMYLYV